jgi:hypothetical protein
VLSDIPRFFDTAYIITSWKQYIADMIYEHINMILKITTYILPVRFLLLSLFESITLIYCIYIMYNIGRFERNAQYTPWRPNQCSLSSPLLWSLLNEMSTPNSNCLFKHTTNSLCLFFKRQNIYLMKFVCRNSIIIEYVDSFIYMYLLTLVHAGVYTERVLWIYIFHRTLHLMSLTSMHFLRVSQWYGIRLVCSGIIRHQLEVELFLKHWIIRFF